MIECRFGPGRGIGIGVVLGLAIGKRGLVNLRIIMVGL